MFYNVQNSKYHINCVLAFIRNIALVYLIYTLCRIIFIIENWNFYNESLSDESFGQLLIGSLIFDTSAILYTNSLYALMMLVPWYKKETKGWQNVAKCVFIIVNSLSVIVNFCDTVYVQFTNRRTTTSVFSEFKNERNLSDIFGHELIKHWYLVLIGILLIYSLFYFYKRVDSNVIPFEKSQKKKYYLVHSIIFCTFVFITICGIRGGVTKGVHPITLNNATEYVVHPHNSTIVLNTPFSLIRTIGKKVFPKIEYYTTKELAQLYSPVHKDWGKTDMPMNSQSDSTIFFNNKNNIKKNVVILILEGLGREFIGAYNTQLDCGKYKGYTPFIDSLYQHSLSFDYTFANGRRSIDAMPSILVSIPLMVESYMSSHASMNEVNSLATELKKIGYESSFFHGAVNGSMGFQSFANFIGFDAYYGRDEYNQDKRFNGDNDYDGTWAIWDEEFLQYFALKTAEMKEPFLSTVFTASSHHPFVIPERYKKIFPEEGNNQQHKCIRYVDHALQHYFDTARKHSWFNNTIFVLCSDHTSMPDHDEYKSDLGIFAGSILFYDPTGELIKPGRRHCIAQQIDIMPTILGLLNYDKPYIAFGNDLTKTSDTNTWAILYNNGIYQLVRDNWFLQFDGERVKGLFNFKKDWRFKHNMTDKQPKLCNSIVSFLKAIIQSYMSRMNENRLVVSKEN